jgi:hypothetical protein
MAICPGKLAEKGLPPTPSPSKLLLFLHSFDTVRHGLVNYMDTKAKCRHLKIFTCKRYFAAGVYQSLQTGDAVSHVGIFDPAL